MDEMTIYEQLTISDWLDMKEKLRRELLSVTQSFVRIGYALRKIDDQKMYEADGHKSIAEFAKIEYGLESSTVSRLMAINREYSIDGYSERLKPEYIGIGQSKLSEMLQLPEADRALITDKTQRSDIRELKNFNKSEPDAGEADDIRTMIESFFRENKEELNRLYGMMEGGSPLDEKQVQAAIDLLNPSGSRMYRKGFYMLFLYETDVKIKRYGEDPITHTWGDFLAAVDEIFGVAAAGHNTWERYFGEEEPEEKIAPAQKSDQPEEKNAHGKTEGDQNTQESVHDEQENDQEDPETMEWDAQDQKMAAAMNPPEEIAPAQKEEPAAAEPLSTKYKEGDMVILTGTVDMITTNGKVINYRIRTQSGKTVWCIEDDIREEES